MLTVLGSFHHLVTTSTRLCSVVSFSAKSGSFLPIFALLYRLGPCQTISAPFSVFQLFSDGFRSCLVIYGLSKPSASILDYFWLAYDQLALSWTSQLFLAMLGFLWPFPPCMAFLSVFCLICPFQPLFGCFNPVSGNRGLFLSCPSLVVTTLAALWQFQPF